MPIPWPVAFMFVLGIVLIALIGRILLIPGRLIWRIAANGAAGALLLLGINLLSGFTGFSLPLNPFSALTAGFLGIPGILLLTALMYLL
ncbi:MAG: pro-sigmaK processing inhibitor BofA family protein [Clostridia bacterium]|nr:pro-sigmaK processing inhibitor BofA family protein [Clostridia bacterium]MBQ4157708.1 pro-sigmaK processing inhibitor BofA family protein [Clostridia bacterium]MBQ4620368.1 pro-sigmaK processing inhibitor BofA family protein [Clostridia bacterium]MBQ9855011.1 pro-sigmaK processing inhibitor BofA family protein [Clostridia bacterium]